MLEILKLFAIAGSQLEITLKCWSLQRNAGDLATMCSCYNNNNNNNTIYLQLAEEIAKANKGQLYTTFTIFSKNN